jgi:hypothetical protein
MLPRPPLFVILEKGKDRRSLPFLSQGFLAQPFGEWSLSFEPPERSFRVF